MFAFLTDVGQGLGVTERTKISIVIPVYNEIRKLKRAVDLTIATLSELDCTSEIFIAEDGSTDGTYEYASEIELENSNIRLLHSDKRQGRGHALSRAIRGRKG